MTTEKFIRILGYIVYTALWSPVIVLAMVIFPIVDIAIFKSIKTGLKVYWNGVIRGISHGINFIRTGEW